MFRRRCRDSRAPTRSGSEPHLPQDFCSVSYCVGLIVTVSVASISTGAMLLGHRGGREIHGKDGVVGALVIEASAFLPTGTTASIGS
jgi:hypothetical protein